VGGAAELAGRVEGGPDDQAVGHDVVPGRDRPVLASSTRIPRILLPIDWPALVAWKVEVGEVGQLDQNERARRGLELDVDAVASGRWRRGALDTEQVADGGEDPNQQPVQERGHQASPEARQRLAGWPGLREAGAATWSPGNGAVGAGDRRSLPGWP
jgi:hypothetical protein